MSDKITSVADLGKYKDIVHQSALASAGLAVPGTFVPGVDLLGVSGVWISMIYRIAETSGNGYIEKGAIQRFCVNLAQGAGSYYFGSKALQWLLIATGVGAIGAVTLNSALNYLYTARLGVYIAEQFDRPDFHMENVFSGIGSIIPIMFAIPSIDELKFVFGITKDV
ncbi:hypothetical protein Sta7437_4885 (plasmid) [Stanieria cyanosphaera PCC 7437]|uniref:Uncharacterized protein n=1 Tax=Stanieria cyanosphaera (strain ATCC 29371 / PCC 7437) TaxID=111780 RepID=K9Y0P4_STAC7|nr:hypothetical protein Sta7437_4885 [Stanieria cyanosphaera PCC 7437]